MNDEQQPPLALHHQQILAFVSSYLRTNDCLPSSREAAVACGFRSPHTVGRLVGDLERLGVLHRNPDYPRLGWVPSSLDVPSIPEDEQLWWAERDCIEHEAALAALPVGLRFAPDLDAVAAIHAEGTSRVIVLRALHDTRRRLHQGGATLRPDGVEALHEQRDVARRAHELLEDWDSYCIVRLVWNLSAREGLAQVRPLELGYLGSALGAALRTTESLLPTYWAHAAPALVEGLPDVALSEQLSELLSRLRRGRTRNVPHGPERADVDLAALLATHK